MPVINDESRRLRCLIEGESLVFTVTAGHDVEVGDLKKEIREERKLDTLKNVGHHTLELWKPNDSNPITAKPSDTLAIRIGSLGDSVSQFANKLEPTDSIFSIFPKQPPNEYLHIIVKVPPTADIPVRTKTPQNDAGTRTEAIDKFLERLRPRIKEFLSRPRHPVWMPPETVDANTRQFYHNLAIPSINDKPNLLLHNPGDKTNPNRDTLFQNGEHHRILCNTSGAGKTALVFNGLCSHWGFYFVAAQDSNKIGAKDLELAIEIMSHSPEWIQDAFQNPSLDAIQNASDGNERIAFRWVYKVLLTRWYIFRAFVEVAKEQHAGNLPHDVKRDWLLFQILPVVHIDHMHPFVAFMNLCLVGMSTPDLLCSLVSFTPGGVLGSAFNDRNDNFFYILDEAHAAGERYMGAFADANREIRRPVLRPIIRAWMVSDGPIRFIVSGTGFSLSLFKTILTSGVGKASPGWRVVHQTGDFINRGLQESYVARYLPSSFLSSPSGTVLVSRMYEWLRGRHCFTATLIEQLLAGAWTSKGPSSPQKLLNAYVHVLTNFTPIDCDDALLAIEPDVNSPELQGFPWYKLMQDKGPLQELSTSLYTYVTQGKYPMWSKDRQDLVKYGVARFKGEGEEVIVEEPIALVGISRYFEAEGLMIDGDIRVRMQTEKGSAFEEAVLLFCTRIFRGTTHRGKKDPKAPRRPFSAYMFFSQDWRNSIKAENPGAGFGEVGKLLGAKWKELDDEERKPYLERAAQDKNRAEKEKAAYEGNKKGSAAANGGSGEDEEEDNE